MGKVYIEVEKYEWIAATALTRRFTMSEFFNGLFNILYGAFGVPLLLIVLIILVIVVSQRRRKKKMKQEDWMGHSPVEKIEKEDEKKK